MADSNHTRRDDYEGFSQDDPFAELTRIMGHDPRAPQAPASAAPSAPTPSAAQPSYEDDFDIDLEKELMGEFDFSEFDAPSAEPQREHEQAYAPQPTYASEQQSYAPAEPVYDEPEQTYEQPAYDDAPVYEATQSYAPAEPAYEQPTHAYEPEQAYDDGSVEPQPSHPVAAAPYEDPLAFEISDLDLDFSETDFSTVEAEDDADEPLPQPYPPVSRYAEEEILPAYEPVAEAEPEVALQPEAEAEPDFELPPFEVEFEDSLAVSDEPVAVEEPVSAPAAYAIDDLDAELQRELANADTSFDTVDARAKPEPEFVAAVSPEPAPSYEADAGHWGASNGGNEAAWEATPVAGAADASLEDELSALLSDEAPKPAQSSDLAWTPAVNTFGRANFPRATPTAYVPETKANSPQPVPEAQPVQHFAESVVSSDLLADDDFADIFGEELTLNVEDDLPEPAYAASPAYEPTTYPAAASAPAAFPDLQPEEIEVAQPVMRPAFPAAAVMREAAPEVETVEVIENAQAITDDLDIPELDYGEPDAPLYDDLESEITQAFGGIPAEPVAEETRSWSVATPVAASVAGAAIGAGVAAHASAAPAPEYADQYALGDSEWQAQAQLADDAFDYETDLEQAIGMAAYEEEEARAPNRKRGLLIAAVVAGIAVVGGAGVYAMSLFGGGSDGPAVVRLDGDPMKVRPENPGGVTVPNQDSQAYQRVAGGTSPTAPEQERLISTSEEPVDVTVQGEDVPLLPPGVTTGLAPEVDDAVGGLLKSEDRIAPETESAGNGSSQELAAVAPRRVRTMVVRPDGSMVPREEPAVAEPEQVSSVANEAVATPVAPLPSLGQTPGLEGQQVAQPALTQDDGPVLNMPETVSVFPTPRVEPQAQTAAQAPAAQLPVVQQPAASQLPPVTQASAPAAAAPAAAAASEWSMQIASQPTAEGAQSNYQDLARRYGNVLEGRGVNIVRADIQGMGTYYRVRIPASNRDEAIQLCTRYKAAGGSCFVSR